LVESLFEQRLSSLTLSAPPPKQQKTRGLLPAKGERMALWPLENKILLEARVLVLKRKNFYIKI
jgi:hypothetical protein